MSPQPPDLPTLPPSGAATGGLGEAEFRRFATLIEDRSGIRLPAGKRTMLEGRLRKRLIALGLADFGAYLRQLARGDPAELTRMIDEVTTNKTDFFREPFHFEYLVQRALPALGWSTRTPAGGLRVWSAGCSTGEEPWTLAMVLAEAAKERGGAPFDIVASDLSTRALAHAVGATYEEARVEPVPLALRQRYLLRRRDGGNLVRIVPALRERVRFEHLNLLASAFHAVRRCHVVFCRNVFIYFERSTQQQVLEHFREVLVPGGYVFVGHSESLSGLSDFLTQVAPTVYRLNGGPA